MVQVLCRMWGVGMFGILALTTSNILLTLRLLWSSQDSPPYCDGRVEYGQMSWKEEITHSNHSSFLEFLRTSAIVVNKPPKGYEAQRKYKYRNGNVSRDQSPHEGDFVIDPRLGRFDNARLFRTFDKVFTGPEYVKLVGSSPACLATQSSVDRLYWLTQVSKNWENAPMSIAIFVPDVEYSIARAYLKYLVACFPYFGRKISVHFTFPIQHPPKDVFLQLNNLLVQCQQPLSVLQILLSKRPTEMRKWRDMMQYPQNLLRNVARKNCGTEWVFLTDVDIIPTPGLAAHLSTFLRSKEADDCSRCAFVVPTYEVSEKATLPFNRTMLLRLVATGKARPFHQKVFVYNQHATNFSRWEARELTFPQETKVTVSHSVTDFEFFYEPFYISRDSVPPHDERFLGYGFTRNTQVYEMFVAGYTFRVLSPVFSLHWGMQVKRGRPAWRERQNGANRKLFEGFKREIAAKYQRDPLGMMRNKTRKKT